MCAAFSDGKALCWGSSFTPLLGLNANAAATVVQPNSVFVQLPPLAPGDTLLPSFVQPAKLNCVGVAPADPAVAPYMRCWGRNTAGIQAQDVASAAFGISSTAPG